jgi:hypothetical protein
MSKRMVSTEIAAAKADEASQPFLKSRDVRLYHDKEIMVGMYPDHLVYSGKTHESLSTGNRRRYGQERGQERNRCIDLLFHIFIVQFIVWFIVWFIRFILSL